MKNDFSHLETGRIITGPVASRPGSLFGAFQLKAPTWGVEFMCLVANGEMDPAAPWEHVSARCRDRNGERCPNWREMCLIKSLFWEEEECVVQYHPPKSQYVNTHPNVLHLWRYVGPLGPLPTPPKFCV